MRTFRPNQILHIEDDPSWHDELATILTQAPEVKSYFGSSLERIVSPITDEISNVASLTEIARIIDIAKERPSLIHVGTGQLARAYFENNIPEAAISDTTFPLNGAKTVQWLLTHGLADYPLIGLSAQIITAREISDLDPKIVVYFMTHTATYFAKPDLEPRTTARFVNQILYNVDWTRNHYSNK